jgi:hypothetical protein
MATDTEKIELLFKKAIGVPNANPGSDALQEVPGNAGPRIIPTAQIYAETIPPVAPGHSTSAESLVSVDTSANTIIKGVLTQTRGAKEKGSTNPHIIKYTDCKTEYIKQKRSFWFMGTDADNALSYNIFADTIPARFDAKYDSYAIQLKLDLGSGTPNKIDSNDATYPWYFDTGAGVITFWDDLPTTNTPIITFWRYNGIKGSSGGSGNAGATGATGASGTEWIDRYLVNQPPVVVFRTPTITSTDIRIGWEYPTQISANFYFDLFLPYINNLTSFVGFRTTGNADVSMGIINGLGGADYVKLKTSVNDPVTGVILTKINPGPPGLFPDGKFTVLPGTVDISGVQSRVVSYYHPNLEILGGTTATNKLHVYYKGYRTDTFNDNSCGFGIFIAAGPPSEALNLFVKNPAVTSLDLSFNAPQSVDINDPNSSAVIMKYYALYDSSGSSVRYPSGVDISGSFRVLTGGLTPTLDTLYAEAPYTVKVYAKNNSSDISGAPSNDASNNTLPPASITDNMLITALSIPISSNLYSNSTAFLLPTGGSATTGTEIRTQLLKGPRDLSLNIASMTIPIEQFGTRGKLGIGGVPLARLEIELSGGELASAVTARASYDDWATATATVVDVSGITLTAANAAEANSSVYTQGFYRKAAVSGILDLSGAKIVPSRKAYQVRAYQRNKDASSNDITQAPALKVTTNPVSFYYDTFIDSAPTMSSIKATLAASTTSKRVSGVNIVQAAIFDLSYSMTNMGNFVYRNPYVAYGAPAGITLAPLTETDLTKITGGFDTQNGVFTTGAISARRSDMAGTISSGATLAVDLSATPVNIHSAGSALSDRINMVVDPATITLVNNFPLAVPLITASNTTLNTAVSGFHVDSSENTPGYSETLPTSYNHDISLNQNVSLQISSGKFVTKFSTGAPIAYANYSGTYYNNVDQNMANYSSITTAGTRYATFMWDLSSGGSSFNGMVLTLHDAPLSFANRDLQDVTIQYRFMEVAHFNTSDSVPDESLTKYNSIWINGASSSNGSAVTSGNYSSSSNTLYGMSSASSQSSLILSIPKPTGTVAVRVVVRVGIPMNKDISFTRASLYASLA